MTSSPSTSLQLGTRSDSHQSGGSAPTSKTRIFVVDDHAALRKGLCLLLQSQGDMSVVGQAGDSATALKEVALLQPDVITLDVSMPGIDGLSIVERLREICPTARVLILTMHD